MQLLVNVLCFVAGVTSTLAVLVVWAWYLGLQERVRTAEANQKSMEDAVQQFEEQQKKAQDILEQTISDIVKRRQQAAQPKAQVSTDSNVSNSVKDRLRKAVEITLEQAKIDVRKGPDFIVQHNELELEKLTVLKTILADGFDPLITIRYNTGEQEMLLSTYIQSITKGLA